MHFYLTISSQVTPYYTEGMTGQGVLLVDPPAPIVPGRRHIVCGTWKLLTKIRTSTNVTKIGQHRPRIDYHKHYPTRMD